MGGYDNDAGAAGDDPFAITEVQMPVAMGSDGIDLRSAIAGSLVRYGQLEGRLSQAEKAAEAATRSVLADLLPVADALDSISASSPAAEAAVAATRKLLRRTLRTHGVRRLDVVGTVADPELVDVDSVVLDPASPPETVVQEIVAAYLWNGVVLRRGVVVVSHRGTSG